MTFGSALSLLKKNRRLARAGWNGSGQFIQIVTPEPDDLMDLPFIYIQTVQKQRVPWLASQTDLLAEDWQVL